MPKLRKATRDLIKKLIEEDYTDIEISEKVGVTRQTVSKYRREDDIKTKSLNPLVLGSQHQPPIPKEVIKLLYDLQGILGVTSLVEALEIAYKDMCAAVRYRLKYGDNAKTVEDVIILLEKSLMDWEKKYGDLKQQMDDLQVKKQIMRSLSLSP